MTKQCDDNSKLTMILKFKPLKTRQNKFKIPFGPQLVCIHKLTVVFVCEADEQGVAACESQSLFSLRCECESVCECLCVCAV